METISKYAKLNWIVAMKLASELKIPPVEHECDMNIYMGIRIRAFIFVSEAVKSYFNLFWLLTFVQGICADCSCHSAFGWNAAENIAFYFIYATKKSWKIKADFIWKARASLSRLSSWFLLVTPESWIQRVYVRFPFVSFDVPRVKQ